MNETRTYYLRVEGVNLANFVYDTDNLSTIRGGGLMLLELPKRKVQGWLEKFMEEFRPNEKPVVKNVQVITCGASWGLYSFELCDPHQDRVPAALVGYIRDKIKEGSLESFTKTITVKDKGGKAPRKIEREVPFKPRHATVMVEVIEAGKEDAYQEDREKLTALVRWHQMCSPTIAIPSIESEPIPVENDGERTTRRICELDHIRPAAQCSECRINGRKRAVSESSYSRYQYGAWGKSDQWYEDVTGLEGLRPFTHDFHELAEGYSGDKDSTSDLDGKMAVIYLDGNHFGRLQGKYCKTPSDQRAFDKKLREEYQAGALWYLIKKIKDDRAWIAEITVGKKHYFPSCESGEKIEKIRLETLLWGGDEIIWVAPAWRGWWLLGEFFRLVEGGLDGRPWSFKGEPLTFAAGLVFCHNTAPIYRIKELAHQLAEIVKGVSRERNMVAYQVLESFDLAGPDLTALRKQRRPDVVKEEEMILDGREMLEIAGYFQVIKDQVPKRALYRVVQCLYSDPKEAVRRARAIEAELDSRAGECLDCLSACFGKGLGMWLHLLELWDYLVVPQGEETCHV